MEKCSVCEGKDFNQKFSCSNCHGTGKVDWIDNVIPNGFTDYKWIKDELHNIIEPFFGELADNKTKAEIRSTIVYYLETLKFNGVIHNWLVKEDLNIEIEHFGEKIKIDLGVRGFK
jgi:hypothetical protein